MRLYAIIYVVLNRYIKGKKGLLFRKPTTVEHGLTAIGKIVAAGK